MKKTVAILLVVMMFFLSACGKESKSESPVSGKAGETVTGEDGADKKQTKPDEGKKTPKPSVEKDEPDKKEEDKKTAPKVKYPLSDLTLVDNADLILKIIEAHVNEDGDLIFKMFCDNKTGEDIGTLSTDSTVNGYMVFSDWQPYVSAGKKAYSEMIFYREDLEKAGIDVAEKVEFNVWVHSADDPFSVEYVDKLFTVYPTGLDAGSYSEAERTAAKGALVALDDKDLKFTIEKAYVDNEMEVYALQVYAENKTKRDLFFEWSDVTVNGVEIDPYWGSVISAGRRSVSDAEFYLGYFEENGITKVEEIEFKLIVSGMEIADDLFYECEYTLTLN